MLKGLTKRKTNNNQEEEEETRNIRIANEFYNRGSGSTERPRTRPSDRAFELHCTIVEVLYECRVLGVFFSLYLFPISNITTLL